MGKKVETTEVVSNTGLSRLAKLLTDDTRRAIIKLCQQERNVSELCAFTGQSQPSVSHHLNLLGMGGFVTMRKDGKYNFYSANNDAIMAVIDELKALMS